MMVKVSGKLLSLTLGRKETHRFYCFMMVKVSEKLEFHGIEAK